MIPIANFLFEVVFMAAGFSFCAAFFKGVLPTPSGPFGVGENYTIFGKEQDSTKLVGIRARIVSGFFAGAMFLISIVLFPFNNLILGNELYSNSLALLIGVVVGVCFYKYTKQL